MTQKFNLYKFVSKFYEKTYEVPPEVFLLMSVRVVLLLCASGLSNETISSFFSIDRRFVVETIKHIYSFDGWKEDREYNPLYYFRHSLIERVIDITDIEFVICSKYLKIFDKIESYYK